MYRCLQLAGLGRAQVAPNPMVGSVLVYEDRIIGEGYHQQYGQAHAEVNCIASVPEEDQHLISQSTLYVSLEPCAHWGKTPPCADLIIRHGIPNVVVGCRDPFEQVNGKGIEKLIKAGIEVTVGVLERACKDLNSRFFTFHTENRPYIILKWAQTGDGKIAAPGDQRLLISNEHSNRLVHKWRSEEAAILVGTNTIEKDNPHLGTRLWPGKHPIRLVVDKTLRLSKSAQVFDGTIPTFVFNLYQHNLPSEKIEGSPPHPVYYYQITNDASLVHQINKACYHLGIQSILVEGGAQLLQSFIDEKIWDEARVIANPQLMAGGGLSAPTLKNSQLKSFETMGESDLIKMYTKVSV